VYKNSRSDSNFTRSVSPAGIWNHVTHHERSLHVEADAAEQVLTIVLAPKPMAAAPKATGGGHTVKTPPSNREIARS